MGPTFNLLEHQLDIALCLTITWLVNLGNMLNHIDGIKP